QVGGRSRPWPGAGTRSRPRRRLGGNISGGGVIDGVGGHAVVTYPLSSTRGRHPAHLPREAAPCTVVGSFDAAPASVPTVLKQLRGPRAAPWFRPLISRRVRAGHNSASGSRTREHSPVA